MHVLHVTETAKGGVGTYIDMVAAWQARHGDLHSVRVVAPLEHVGQFVSTPRGNITTFDRPSRSPGSLMGMVRTVRRLIREQAPDVIHLHSTFAGLVLRPLLGWRRRPAVIVYCPHGWVTEVFGEGSARRIAGLVERGLSRFCDRIIAVSQSERRLGEAIGIAPDKITVILNAMEKDAPLATAANWIDPRRKLLFIGRLDRQKGFDILEEAVRPLADRVVVKVAGAAVVQNAGDRTETAPNISYEGWMTPNQVEGLLAAADLLVLPSRWEGLPLTPLEAMRAAKPVVATTVGGIPEVIVEGETGRLVQSGDVEALRAALLRDDRGSLERMGEAGRARFLALFTADRLNRDLRDLYLELTAYR